MGSLYKTNKHFSSVSLRYGPSNPLNFLRFLESSSEKLLQRGLQIFFQTFFANSLHGVFERLTVVFLCDKERVVGLDD